MKDCIIIAELNSATKAIRFLAADSNQIENIELINFPDDGKHEPFVSMLFFDIKNKEYGFTLGMSYQSNKPLNLKPTA